MTCIPPAPVNGLGLCALMVLLFFFFFCVVTKALTQTLLLS